MLAEVRAGGGHGGRGLAVCGQGLAMGAHQARGQGPHYRRWRTGFACGPRPPKLVGPALEAESVSEQAVRGGRHRRLHARAEAQLAQHVLHEFDAIRDRVMFDDDRW